MPVTKTSSELQRNIGPIYDFCDRTGEPVYVTRNGQSTLVVLSAESFEEMRARQAELEEELRLYKALMESEVARLKGETYVWDDIQKERAALDTSAA